ncbi:adenosylmethionine decarboxylase [Peribacillus alkalitolerans]|uniref:adenosylmethionine decarboxylase n=1 Tax=Peribacillus alkalitolerans TaxID=1550385 RepID=UPI0013D1F9FA|nr:adenosylmethionine decarboxylase [Peribacillus alkalitolerans]
MDTKGQHSIIDAFECNPEILNDAPKLKELMTQAVTDLEMEILSTFFHSFSPEGVAGVLVLSTSHISIHTWPEHGYAALDLYTCGNQQLWPVLRVMLEKMEVRRVVIHELSRGFESIPTPIMKKMNLVTADSEINTPFMVREDLGNDKDLKQFKELMTGNHNILYNGSSHFQDIVLVEAKDLRLYIGQELQFSSLDESYYHEALIFPAMELTGSPERVLILGGGDGLGLREVLKYSTVKQVDLVDIDSTIINLAKTNPSLLAQNSRSFLDDRVQIHIEDAKSFITNDLQPYDVIIIDFPDPVDAIISSLYTKELFSQVATLLSSEGVLVCQSNSPEDAPIAYWSIGETIKSSGLNTLPYNVIVPSFGLWGYHLGAHKELTKKLPDVTVPHKTFSSEKDKLFQIPSSIKALRKLAIVNTYDELKLHEIYKEEMENMI